MVAQANPAIVMLGAITTIVGVLCLIYRESVNGWLTRVYRAGPIRAWRNEPFSDGFAIPWGAVLLVMGITLVVAGLVGP
jgi:hypothetical protein